MQFSTFKTCRFVLNISGEVTFPDCRRSRPPRRGADFLRRRHKNFRGGFSMTYVVCEPCVNCRYTHSVVVCPLEAFHLADNAVWINPETCIDSDACVPECPAEAIFAADKVPDA